jgi:hypothetical protein
MSYTVVWTPDAEAELAAVWMAATDRTAVTAAAHLLEQDLRRSPLTAGESRRSSVERIVYLPPLGLSFVVVVDDRKVFVTAVVLVR